MISCQYIIILIFFNAETVDLAPGQQPSSSSKVCGHSCQGTGGEVCCLCNKKRKRRRSPSSPECVPVEDMCVLCARYISCQPPLGHKSNGYMVLWRSKSIENEVVFIKGWYSTGRHT